MKKTLISVALALLSMTAIAAPFTYNATLSNGVPVTGQISPSNTYNQPDGAQYYRFFANAGDTVTVTGTRHDADYDMGFWVFKGLYSDTSSFSGGSNSAGFDDDDPGYVAFNDDEIAPGISGGPFGDPLFVKDVGDTGTDWYTVAVINYQSGPVAGDNQLFDYALVANGVQNVPEPGSVALIGLALAGVAVMRRRKS